MEPENNVNLPRLERKRRRRPTAAGIVVLIVFYLLCAGMGYWIAQVFDPFPPEKQEEQAQAAAYGPSNLLNILLLGVDQREAEAARADTIILACLNLDDKEVHLLSIPRDTRVSIPGRGVTRKINYAHAVGGAELTVQTVEEFLKIPVHYYVETNFEGFSGLIDILGGITLNVEQDMYYPDENIDLKAGLQKLDGSDALSYVRWRSDGRGDIGRIERQQKFFRALADQALCFSTIWKIPELLGELNKQVKTDLKVQKMIALANTFRDIDNIRLTTATVPGHSDDVNYGGSYWIADMPALTALLQDIYSRQKNGQISGILPIKITASSKQYIDAPAGTFQGVERL